MARTDRFRADHQDMLKLVQEITGQLVESKLAADATGVAKLLSTLVGKLKIHLSTEDNVLYPDLAKSADQNVKAIAEKFQKEMSGIKPVVDAFATKWNAGTIAKDPSGFVAETKKLFGALGDRITRENNELYSAADKLVA